MSYEVAYQEWKNAGCPSNDEANPIYTRFRDEWAKLNGAQPGPPRDNTAKPGIPIRDPVTGFFNEKAWIASDNTGRRLDAAMKEWHDAERPEDSNHPAYVKFKAALEDYVRQQTQSLFKDPKWHKWTRKNPLTGHGATGGEAFDVDKLNADKLNRAWKAARSYDPAHPSRAKFTTWLRKPMAQAEIDALRRTPTMQQVIARSFPTGNDITNGHRYTPDHAKWDYYVLIHSGIPERYAEVAKWVACQEQDARITWREVARAFAEFDSQDKAQRALQWVKDCVEELKEHSRPDENRLRRLRQRRKAMRAAPNRNI